MEEESRMALEVTFERYASEKCRYCGENPKALHSEYCSRLCALDSDLHRQRQQAVDSYLDGYHSTIRGLR